MFILSQIVNLDLVQKNETGWFTPGNIVSIVSALLAASAVIYNASKTTRTMSNNNKDSIDANLIAKARLEWIKEVRDESASFISLCYEFIEYSSISQIKIEVTDATSDSITIGIDEVIDSPKTSIQGEDLLLAKETLVNKLNLKANLLILYFGPDEIGKNQNIIDKVNKILGIIKMEDPSAFITKMKDEVEDFRDDIRLYLKEEWKQAKTGK